MASKNGIDVLTL